MQGKKPIILPDVRCRPYLVYAVGLIVVGACVGEEGFQHKPAGHLSVPTGAVLNAVHLQRADIETAKVTRGGGEGLGGEYLPTRHVRGMYLLRITHINPLKTPDGKYDGKT